MTLCCVKNCLLLGLSKERADCTGAYCRFIESIKGVLWTLPLLASKFVLLWKPSLSLSSYCPTCSAAQCDSAMAMTLVEVTAPRSTVLPCSLDRVMRFVYRVLGK